MNKNKVVGLLLSSVMVAGLAACGGGGSGNNSDNQPSGGTASEKPAGPKTVLKYWTDDRHDQEYIQEVIKKFNETNKDNITVEVTVMSENFKQAVDIAYASNQAPDLFRVKNIKELVKKDYLEPLDALLSEDQKNRFSFSFEEGKNVFDGKLYSLPSTGTTMRLIYNKDLFDKAGIANPPKSLQEMVDAAKKITEVGKKDGIYGFALNYKNPTSAFDRSIGAVLNMSGEHRFGYDLTTGKYDFTAYGEVMKYFHQMYKDGSIIPGAETLDIDPMRAQFAQGKIGMYMSYSVEPGVYQNQFPTQINWAAALVPTLDGTIKGAAEINTDGGWIGMNKKTPNKEQAWKFMTYMYSGEVQQPYHEKGLGLSIVPAVVSKSKVPDIKGMEGFLTGKYDAVCPIFPWVAPEGAGYADTFFKYMLQGGDVNAIVADLNARYDVALKKAVEKGEAVVKPIPDFDPMKLQGK